MEETDLVSGKVAQFISYMVINVLPGGALCNFLETSRNVYKL